MPRAGWVKPESDQRLSDHISLGVLTRVFPAEVIDEVLAECGRLEQRHRLLPARVVVYYVLGLALFSSSSYEEVMRMLVSGHSWASGWAQEWTVPTQGCAVPGPETSGIQTVAAVVLSDRAAVGCRGIPGDFYRSWHLLSIDGLCLDLPGHRRERRAVRTPTVLPR